MSALDQAFIKAYCKDAGIPMSSTTAQRTKAPQRSAPLPASTRQPPSSHYDDPYVEGAWYRVESEAAGASVQEQIEQAEPAAASAIRKRPRSIARKPHMRFRPEQPQTPVVGIPPLGGQTDRLEPELQQPELQQPELQQSAPAPSTTAHEEPPTGIAPVSVSISPASFSSVFAVAYAGGWESQIAISQAPQLTPPIEIPPWGSQARRSEPEFQQSKPTALPAAPETVVKVESQAVLAPSPQTILRADPPEPSAVAKPHFPLVFDSKEDKATDEKDTVAPATSAATSEAQSDEEAEAVAKPDFEPAWEVERFSWPVGSEELLASALDDWGLAVRQLLAAAKEGCKTLAVTGLRRGEGRSTLTLCLARLAAQTGAQIALVDADFENPQLATRLGVGTECDWRATLADGLPLSEAAIVCLADQLTLIPLQMAVPFKQASFRQPVAAGMLKTLAQAYDLVLVDVGPIAGPENTTCWGGKACPFDGVLLVRDLRRTDAEETAATVTHLRQLGIDRVVVLENFAGI